MNDKTFGVLIAIVTMVIGIIASELGIFLYGLVVIILMGMYELMPGEE